MTAFSRLFSVVLCNLLLIGTAYADQRTELENLRKRISAVQREMDKTSESKSDVADDLRDSERAISDINRKLAALNGQLHSTDQRLGELQMQEHELRNRIEKQQILLGKLLRQQYLGGKQEHLKLLLNGQNPNQIALDLQYYSYIAKNRAEWLSALHKDLSELGAVSVSLREQRAEVALLQAEKSSQKNKLNDQHHVRQRMLSKISRKLSQQRSEIKRLQHNEDNLAKLVEEISGLLSQPESNALFHNEKLPDRRFDGNPFSQLKGKLTLPVRGAVTNRFNTPRPDSAILWKGLFLRTSSGQAVKAIAAGQVVYSDWLRGFGNLLIVDHGNNYMSLYGNNETLYKQVGDILHGGDTIAAVGNSGGNTDFGLYFELRYKSQPLDPMKWMAK